MADVLADPDFINRASVPRRNHGAHRLGDLIDHVALLGSLKYVNATLRHMRTLNSPARSERTAGNSAGLAIPQSDASHARAGIRAPLHLFLVRHMRSLLTSKLL